MRDLFHLQTDPPAGGSDVPPADPLGTAPPPVNPDSIEGDPATPTVPGPEVTPPAPPPPPPLSPDSPSDAAAGTTEPSFETDAAREARQDAELQALQARHEDEPSQVMAQPSGLPAEPSSGGTDAAVAAVDVGQEQPVAATALPEATVTQAGEDVPVGPTGEVAPADAARQGALQSLQETATVFAQKCNDAIESGVSVMEVLGIASAAIQSVQR